MPNLLETFAEIGIDIGTETLEKISEIAKMETTDYNAILKGMEDLGLKVTDYDDILNLKKHAMQFQQAVSKDGAFIENLDLGLEAIGKLSLVKSIVEVGTESIEMVGSIKGMVDVVRNEDMTEAEKVADLEEKFLQLKEEGADVFMSVVDATFGNIPIAGSAISNWSEEKLRDFITSEDGLEKLSNGFGDWLDKQTETLFDKTGLTEKIQDYVARRRDDSPEDEEVIDYIEKRKELIGDTEVDQGGMVLPDELPATGADVSDVDIENISRELEANTDLLFQNIEKYKSSVQGI